MRYCCKRFMNMLLAVVMCFNMLPVSYVGASENSALEDTARKDTEREETGSEERSSIYEGENYKVIFSITSSWKDAYNADVTIENTGDKVIHNWYLQFPFKDEITNLWNAEVYSNQDHTYILKNAGHNQDIAVGQSVNFGFTAKGNFGEFPKEYKILGQSTEKLQNDYTIDYQVNNDWESGFEGSISITNNTDKDLEDWALEFDYNRNMNNLWNGQIKSHDGNHYLIENAGYNANIHAGETISIGFTGDGGTVQDEPHACILFSYELYAGDSMELDTDGDGIVDGYETALGMNYQSVDSDSDGLTDSEEINVTHTNPTKADTDENGINDAEDDMDGDGLSNREEVNLGTSPIKSDTDGDNLTDYEEINTYHTDPLVADTDGDKLTDYDDIQLGFDPLKKDTDENGIIDSEEKLQ